MRTKSYWAILTVPAGALHYTSAVTVLVKFYESDGGTEYRGEWAVPDKIDYSKEMKDKIGRFLKTEDFAANCSVSKPELIFNEP